MNDPAPNPPANRVAARMAGIAPFHVMEIQQRAFELEAAGRRIVHMEIGQPDFAAPPQVVEAAVAAMRERRLGYTDALGIPELREAIARYYREHHGVAVAPGRIVVTTGASGAFMLAMGILVNPGDGVLMSDPCYPCNRNFVRFFGGEPVAVAVDEGQQYQLALADLRKYWQGAVRGVLLASPSNPTGTVIAQDELARILEFAAARRGFAIVDEIYLGLAYNDGGASLPTALALSDEAFVINSFSKYFSMTGWRLGWLVAPQWAVREIEKFAQNAFICPPAPAQYAALACFRPDTLALLEERRLEFQRRRDFLVPALRKLGFRISLMPQGAFYIYAGCEAFTADSSRFAWDMLEEVGVAITPGLDFGENRPERHVRFAYTRAMADIEAGVERLGKFLGR